MNFNYAISQAKTEYDVTGDLEDLQEIGLIAYDKIGNKNIRKYKNKSIAKFIYISH